MPIHLINTHSNPLWWNGTAYHQHSQAQFQLAEKVLRDHVFKGNETVLDIGCGDGEFTQFIGQEKVPLGSVIGIDASPSMIETALANRKQPNVNFQEGLAETFHCDTQFDLIVSFSALHWVADQQAVWNNICRHLKKDGYALISLNPPPRNKEFADSIDEVCQSQQFSPFFRNFIEKSVMSQMSIQDYEQVIINAGLKVEECRQSWLHFEFPTKEACINNVKAWLPHVAQVPQRLQDAFVESIITKFLAKSHQVSLGKVKIPYNNFKVKASFKEKAEGRIANKAETFLSSLSR